MSEYVEKFAQLVDQLTAYGHVTEPVYYAMCFVDGLNDDIRASVSMHRPSTFDTAASLALLQEDVASKHRDARRMEFSGGSKGLGKGPHPLPVPPTSADYQGVPVLPDEKKLCEGKSPEEKLAALRAFRKAKGLCMRCAEKWSRDHKCSAQVQLHVVQELLELFHLDDFEQLSREAIDSEQLYLALSKEVVSRADGPRP